MAARLSAFAVWALVAATAIFWGLRLFVRAPVAPSYVTAVGEGGTTRGDLTRLLGATPVAVAAVAPPPDAAGRFRLLGVVAPKTAGAGGRSGVALIAVDGKLPKAFAVGSNVDGDLVLQSVSLRTASIGIARGAAPITLELPLPTAAATGTLPVGGMGNAMPTQFPAAVPPPYVAQPGGPNIPGMVPGLPPPGVAPAN